MQTMASYGADRLVVDPALEPEHRRPRPPADGRGRPAPRLSVMPTTPAAPWCASEAVGGRAPATPDVEHPPSAHTERRREVVDLARLRPGQRVGRVVGPERARVDHLRPEPEGEEVVRDVVVAGDGGRRRSERGEVGARERRAHATEPAAGSPAGCASARSSSTATAPTVGTVSRRRRTSSGSSRSRRISTSTMTSATPSESTPRSSSRESSVTSRRIDPADVDDGLLDQRSQLHADHPPVACAHAPAVREARSVEGQEGSGLVEPSPSERRSGRRRSIASWPAWSRSGSLRFAVASHRTPSATWRTGCATTRWWRAAGPDPVEIDEGREHDSFDAGAIHVVGWDGHDRRLRRSPRRAARAAAHGGGLRDRRRARRPGGRRRADGGRAVAPADGPPHASCCCSAGSTSRSGGSATRSGAG